MRLAVVQTLSPARDVEASVRAGVARLEEAGGAGAELAVFPELFVGGYYLDDGLKERASGSRQALARLQRAVDETGVAAVAGVPDLRDGALYNAVAILRPRQQPARYAKTHLFDREQKLFAPGASLWTGEIAGWPCGVLVCYELGFPEVARALAISGARLLLCPAAFGRRRSRIWQIATVARALENQVYVAAADTAGSAGDVEFAGHSRVVDPAGTVIADAGDRAEMLLAEIRPQTVDDVRAGTRDDVHRYWQDRRPELYGSLAETAPDGGGRKD
jgi:predicted amidohydrolase